jgi:hypothetical protein
MKYIFVLLLLTPAITFCQDVRKCRWGMTMDSVRKVETGKPYSAISVNNTLSYKVEIDGYHFTIAYYFDKGRLFQCVMLYDEKHSNTETFYDNFLRISKKLESKYGDYEDRTKWKSTLFKDDESKYGLAAADGEVVFIRVWETTSSLIFLTLHGDNFECSMGLVYKDVLHVDKDETGF